MDDWPTALACPICGDDIPVNQIGNEYNGHKVEKPDLEFDTFVLAAEQNRML